MTDILIRGMEMPQSCDECPLADCYWACNSKSKHCPLIELPQHGDLIDLSELQKFPIRLDHYDKEHGDEHFVYGIESLMEYAECLPVIVPTERRDADA